MSTRLIPIDPQLYRWFWIDGDLKITDDYTLLIIIAVHADDLAPGTAGAEQIAERTRKHYGQLYGNPDASWSRIVVTETYPGQAFIGDPLKG